MSDEAVMHKPAREFLQNVIRDSLICPWQCVSFFKSDLQVFFIIPGSCWDYKHFLLPLFLGSVVMSLTCFWCYVFFLGLFKTLKKVITSHASVLLILNYNLDGFYFYTANGNLSVIAVRLPGKTPHILHTVEETPAISSSL